ncbi:MAG: (2Fe-2S) ferredoxin domain-containing protein [Kiritimatiellaeota bacterium]|nr:(2Fe-2S) ferredoxin domain-containing protein [Kiritimatiellota bacterium]
MQRAVSPFVCHVFVCTNDRHGERKSCADGQSAKLREQLKEAIHQKPHLQGRVRVSAGGCLGLCTQGPNVLLHPQSIWCSGVMSADLPRLLEAIEAAVAVSVA